MKRCFALATLGLAAATFVLALRADETGTAGKAKPRDAGEIREDVSLREQILARQFNDFVRSLLQLKQRLERSPKMEDRERAVVLGKALDKIQSEGIATRFESLVNYLKEQKLSSVPEITEAKDNAQRLAENLRELLQLLREDTRASKLRDERLRLEELLKKIDTAIVKQRVVQGQTDRGRTDKGELKGNQQEVTRFTGDIARELGKHGQSGDGKDAKGENKDAGKGGQAKSGQAKDAGEAKSGQAKESGKSDGKPGEAKSGDAQAKEGGKPGEGQQAEAKGSKGGDPQAGAKGAKGSKGGEGQAKGNKGGKGGDGQEAQAKDGGKQEKGGIREKAKEGEAQAAQKKEGKGGDQASAKGSQGGKGGQQQASAKPSQGGQKQSGEQKAGGSEGSESKQGQAQSGQSQSGQAQAKSGGDPQSQNKQGPQPPQSAQQQQPNGKKQVEDANYKQHQAEENIAKGQNKPASDKQGEAISDLEKAKKKLEDLLRQIREEELERLLAALEARCRRMLDMQVAVLHGTEQVHKAIEAQPDKKPARENQQASLKLSDDEKDIVLEASKAIEMLESEGSAVAFPEVFQQIREDMKHVQRRLGVVDAGTVTQAIERDIIDTLKEMIEALKKARQELSQNKGGAQPGQPPPNADQKLLDQIAELKMIRSMQLRINARTQTYAREYTGEQAGEARLRQELQNLADRQERVVEVTTRIAKGDNK